MKLVGYAVCGIVAVVVVTVIVALFHSGDVIKAAVEEMGPKLTKAEVKLDKADLSIASGEAALSGLLIGNPSGFTTPHAFKIDNIAVKLDTSTVGKDIIVVNEILIDAPDVIAEIRTLNVNPLKIGESVKKSLNSSNLIAIRNNVNAFVRERGGGSSGDSGREGPKLIIEKFRMNNVKVRAVAHEGMKLDLAVKPFSIALDGIGESEGGLEPEKIAARLIPEIQDKVIDGMLPALMGNVTNMLKDAGKLATGAVKGVVEGAGSAAGGAADAVKSVTEGVGGAVKGLLGK